MREHDVPPLPGPEFDSYALLGRLVAGSPTTVDAGDAARLLGWLAAGVRSERDHREVLLGRASCHSFHRSRGRLLPIWEPAHAPAPDASDVDTWTRAAFSLEPSAVGGAESPWVQQRLAWGILAGGTEEEFEKDLQDAYEWTSAVECDRLLFARVLAGVVVLVSVDDDGAPRVAPSAARD